MASASITMRSLDELFKEKYSYFFESEHKKKARKTKLGRAYYGIN